MALRGFPCARSADHFADSLLLGLMRDELAGVTPPEPERNLAAQISAAGLLVGFHLPDAFADPIALGLGEGGGDRQEQLGQAVACNVAAEIEQMQSDASLLQVLDDLERVESRAEQAIELRARSRTSPFVSLANSGPAAGRSATGTEPLTPSSTTTPSSVRPCMRA